MFFLLKGIRNSVWGTKDLNIGGIRLTNINFQSLGSQVKFTDTMKYYLSSLGSLASTLDDVEKMCWKANPSVSKSTRSFITTLAAFGFRPKKESFSNHC